MLSIKRIFYETRGIANEAHSIERALLLVKELGAYLDIYVIYDELPGEIESFKLQYKKSVIENEETQVELALAGMQLNAKDFHNKIGYRVEEVANTYNRMLDVTVDKNYDIIVKMADNHEQRTGFSALDVQLIRNSEVPVWFAYNNEPLENIKKIMVAIDPETIGHEVGNILTNTLVNYAGFLSKHTHASVEFVSCWELEGLNKQQGTIGAQTIDSQPDFKPEIKSNLLEIIDNASLTVNYRVVHIYGTPIAMLNAYVNDNDIDLLILGTSNVLNSTEKVIGHTAEAIISQIYCDMIIAKPLTK